jgi:hypothetical protein
MKYLLALPALLTLVAISSPIFAGSFIEVQKESSW